MVSSILLQNFKWVALKIKGSIKVGVSDVTYAHRAESVFAMLLGNLRSVTSYTDQNFTENAQFGALSPFTSKKKSLNKVVRRL